MICLIAIAAITFFYLRDTATNEKEVAIAKEPNIETFTVNGVNFDMVRVEGGSFMMGSDDPDSDIYEKPVHREDVKDFHIGSTEVTQELWKAVMGTNPSYFQGNNLPVEQVSWNDCQIFLDRLSELTGRKFRLPTEIEWEYAARGGNRSSDYKWSGSNDIGSVAWYDENSEGKTHPVASMRPNELGLYDMSGNVWELTSDFWSNNYNIEPADNSPRVCRGGGWINDSRYCRSAKRGFSTFGTDSHLGLRLAF